MASFHAGLHSTPESALEYHCCQHPSWTFIVASICAGLLLVPASLLDFYCCQHPRWTFVGSINIVVDSQRLLLDLPRTHAIPWAYRLLLILVCRLFSWSLAGDSFLYSLVDSFGWSADSFCGPSPETLFFIVSWNLLGGPQTLFVVPRRRLFSL